MNRQLRTLTLFTCITAATAFTGQSAFADYGFPADGPGAGSGEQQKHKGHKGHKGQKGHQGGHFFQRMARELNLSDQQRAEAKTLFEQGRAEHKPLMDAMGGERRKLQSLIHSGNADEAAIRAQAAKVAAVQSDLAVLRGQQAKQFAALLTPDQAAKLKELREKGKGHFGGFPGCSKKAD